MTNLASVTQRQLEQWRLHRDGEPIHGPDSVVVPVRTSDGETAVLKITSADAESDHAHLALRRWGGDGAARLLSADPPRHALLLERLHGVSLASVSDVDACEVVGGLYRRLEVEPLIQLRTLTSYLADWGDELRALPRSAAVPHRLVEQAIALCRDLGGGPDARVLHGNLHYSNVLAADRQPWLAISPQPLNGDPHYEIAPMLWNRWEEISGDIRGGVHRRFYALVDAAGLDEDRARAFVVVRVVRQAIRDPAQRTKYVALAKAVQD